MKELYRRLLISIFPQSPSLQVLYPGVPRTPWNRKRSMTELAHWYGLETTSEAYSRGVEEGLAFKESFKQLLREGDAHES